MMILCVCMYCGKWVDTRADFNGVVLDGMTLHLACALTIVFKESKTNP